MEFLRYATEKIVPSALHYTFALNYYCYWKVWDTNRDIKSRLVMKRLTGSLCDPDGLEPSAL